MEIRTLRYFLAVAREGSITRAANFLHLTQPTLSRQMQDLEEELGRPLLVRKSHRVDLTPEGVLLRKRAEEIVAMVDKTEAEFTALEDTVSGDVYIGSGETRGLCPIAKVIRQLRAESPAIRYHLYSGNAQDVTDRLDKGLLDFGIVIEPADISKYDALSLPARDVWGVLMRRDSPLAAKERIEKADLLDLPLLCSRQVITPHPGENAFVDWFGEDFGKLDIAVNYNLVFNAAILVEAGVGYAITLDGLADTSPESALCFRPLWPRLESGLDIIWKKYQVFSPAAELFLTRLRALVEQSPRCRSWPAAWPTARRRPKRWPRPNGSSRNGSRLHRSWAVPSLCPKGGCATPETQNKAPVLLCGERGLRGLCAGVIRRFWPWDSSA